MRSIDPWTFSSYSPNAFIGGFAVGLDGTAFVLVFCPAGALACTVAVVGKSALTTPLKLGLATETAVAYAFRHTVE